MCTHMGDTENSKKHFFQFPGKTGMVSIQLAAHCFSDIDDDEIYSAGRILSNFIYGLFLEKREVRKSSLNLFHEIMKDTALFIEDKDINTLLGFSNRAFQNGDYQNSLFLSQLILTKINRIIDKKIENDDRTIDKEIIQLQISTLNFIGYLFSKTGKNIEYGIKLATIAKALLNEFDETRDETIALRAAVFDTIGSLYIRQENWEEAIQYLVQAHELDKSLLSRAEIDTVGLRLTCSNLGYAMIRKCSARMEHNGEKLNIHEIEDTLKKAEQYLMMVRVDKPPQVPNKLLKNLELLSAIRRMKEGLALCEKVKKELHKRLL
jgi:tetratricopeptide (TPR) repeat protein